jgi:hypothetical protein
MVENSNADKSIIHARQRRHQQAQQQKEKFQQLQRENITTDNGIVEVDDMIENSNMDNSGDEEDDDVDVDNECCPLGLEVWSIKGYKTRQLNQKNAIDSVI